MKFNVKKIAYIAFISFLTLVGLLVIISAFPIAGNYQIKVVESGSMEPAIKVGSVVVVKPAESYQVGDIVTYEGGFKDEKGKSIPVTHRIVEENTSGSLTTYVTKGDANDDPDNRDVRKGQIIGKVLVDIPYVGYVVASARQPFGFLAIILIPALLIIYDQGIIVWKEIKKMRSKKEELINEVEV